MGEGVHMIVHFKKMATVNGVTHKRYESVLLDDATALSMIERGVAHEYRPIQPRPMRYQCRLVRGERATPQQDYQHDS